MAEERGATLVGGVEAEIRGLVKDVAELKGEFRQMDKRMSNVETAINDLRKDNRQSFNWMVGMWLTTILAIISMSLTILSRLK
ncbi:MAG: hypothetical protein A3F84_27360 [Candidatus Handelsmanbacteria bacterium RIFCSPLOWO2_12_FULL_64_10]|uniref:Uncharacterized protein n=1 Tax=Handelsmanbacteria sp. (strain RIFCSPLOWO2_12_FULL_64_10) TaxID=1817868 RepID=A0A1F6C3W0_HANXR|nr:MAG: hypothetical protein A3F84_27360 [Candidatus Handelsmanbacteria bacterium RIFCSPLOWO2_12_FULL_64_10]